MSITINPYKIDHASVELAELANTLRVMANAADGYHARQVGGTYGAASEAMRKALACGIAAESRCSFTDATEVAQRIIDECIDNGEDVAYQLREVFHPDSGYVSRWHTGGIAVEVIDYRVDS